MNFWYIYTLFLLTVGGKSKITISEESNCFSVLFIDILFVLKDLFESTGDEVADVSEFIEDGYKFSLFWIGANGNFGDKLTPVSPTSDATKSSMAFRSFVIFVLFYYWYENCFNCFN